MKAIPLAETIEYIISTNNTRHASTDRAIRHAQTGGLLFSRDGK